MHSLFSGLSEFLLGLTFIAFELSQQLLALPLLFLSQSLPLVLSRFLLGLSLSPRQYLRVDRARGP